MTLIQNIESRELLDSQGNATLECDVMLECGALGRATAVVGVPNDKRDDDPKRYWGKGVGMALSNVRDLVATQLRGMDSLNQAGVDRTLENLDSIGGNSSLAVSLAVAQAAALAVELPLCRYLGGANARRLPNPIVSVAHVVNFSQFAELLLVWRRSSVRFRERLRGCAEIAHAFEEEIGNRGLRKAIGLRGLEVFDGDEKEILDGLRQAMEVAGYTQGEEVSIGLAMPQASDQMSPEGRREGLVELLKEYPISYVEVDWPDDEITALMATSEAQGVTICGAAPRSRARRLDLNMEKTLTRLLDHAASYRDGGKTLVVSALTAGGADDSFAADLSVALHAEYARFGSLNRAESIAKYNQLLRLEESFG